MSTRNVVAHVAEHLAIQDLLNRFTTALNHRDWATIEGMFTRDATWELTQPELAAGVSCRFETAQGIAQGIASLVSPLEMLVQSNHSPVVEVHGNSATAISTMNECTLAPSAPGRMVAWGTYYDDILCEADGEWRFRARKYRFTWVDQLGSGGEVMTRFPRSTLAPGLNTTARTFG